jgi:hypothetical protein
MVLNKVLLYHMGLVEYTSRFWHFEHPSLFFFSFKCGPSHTNHLFAELDFMSLKSIITITPFILWFSEMASIW